MPFVLVWCLFLFAGWKMRPDLALAWLALCVMSLASMSETCKRLVDFLQGERGEQRTLNDLSDFPDSYAAITNWCSGEEGAGDVDLMVIGPHGVLVAEIKTWTVPCGCERDMWYRLHDNGFRKRIKSPTTQASMNAKGVARALSAGHVRCPVAAVVVFNNRASLKLDSPPIPVIRRRELKAFIENLPEYSGIDVDAALSALLAPQQSKAA